MFYKKIYNLYLLLQELPTEMREKEKKKKHFLPEDLRIRLFIVSVIFKEQFLCGILMLT